MRPHGPGLLPVPVAQRFPRLSIFQRIFPVAGFGAAAVEIEIFERIGPLQVKLRAFPFAFEPGIDGECLFELQQNGVGDGRRIECVTIRNAWITDGKLRMTGIKIVAPKI